MKSYYKIDLANKQELEDVKKLAKDKDIEIFESIYSLSLLVEEYDYDEFSKILEDLDID